MHCLAYSKGARSTGLVALIVIILVLSLSSVACTGQEGQPGAALVVIVASKKDVTVAGSGFRPGELIQLKIMGDKGIAWPLGKELKVNVAGAFLYKLTKRQLKNLPKVPLLFIPGQYVYTVRAIGSEGSLATAPLVWPKAKKKKKK